MTLYLQIYLVTELSHPLSHIYCKDQYLCCVYVCACVCVRVCVNIRKVDRLSQFLRSLPADDRRLEEHESVVKARAVVAFHAGAYEELYRLLESNHFSTSSHAAMQSLWLRAHYRDAERSRGGLPLGAVGKYRIRRRQVSVSRLSV